MSRWILDRRNVAIEHHKPSNRDAVFVKKLNFEALKNTHKINVMSFTQPRALERCRDHFVLKETAKTATVYDARATPLDCQAVGSDSASLKR
jgi:hypothetical protein